jgi:hypothetical protein
METQTVTTNIMKQNKSTNNKKTNILLEFIETEIVNNYGNQSNGNQSNSNKTYQTMREPYKNSEFVPNNMISAIMSHHFPKAEKLHSFNENHLLFKIKIADILNAKIENWRFNRPPDMLRCPDIARYMYNSKKPIDTMIYLTYTNSNDCFEILDGIHRLTALRYLKEENSKQLDLITSGDFGSNNDADWIYNQYLIVNIRFNAVLGDLIETFQTLNKSQTVPDIYIRDVAKEKRDIIDSIANEWQIKFKKHFSSSANPIIGNTNRNKFVDLLDKVYDKYNISDSRVKLFRQVLEEANRQISHNIPTKASIDARVKSKETGCYLFLYKNDKLEELI